MWVGGARNPSSSRVRRVSLQSSGKWRLVTYRIDLSNIGRY